MSVNFFGLLQLMLIGFKLLGVINWSWWLVLLPLYGLVALAVFIMIVGFALDNLIKGGK